jgi:hypothetical protein
MNRNQLFGHLVRSGLAAGALASPLVFGAKGVAFAQNNDKDEKRKDRRRGPNSDKREDNNSLAGRRAVVGTVKSIDGNAKSFVLTTNQGDLTITTNGDTKYTEPGNKDAAFADIKVNERVAASGERPNATTLLAKRVHLMRNTKRTTTTGTITEIAGDLTSFKLTPTGTSTSMTFKIVAQTEIVIHGTAPYATGQTARVVSVKDSSGAEEARRVRIPAA